MYFPKLPFMALGSTSEGRFVLRIITWDLFNKSENLSSLRKVHLFCTPPTKSFFLLNHINTHLSFLEPFANLCKIIQGNIYPEHIGGWARSSSVVRVQGNSHTETVDTLWHWGFYWQKLVIIARGINNIDITQGSRVTRLKIIKQNSVE